LPVADLPRGTVTFLFTDVEGSTRLLQQLGDRYGQVLDAQRRILREAAAARDGREVDTQGDSFFFAFARANAALGAAVVAQRALAGHDWPDGAQLRVRMGLHTGEPEVGEDRYVGLGVHRAARIGGAAHGGQVLLSSATRELVEDEVDGVAVRELGSYRLKDFDRPERLYQLDIDGLPSKFPPVRAPQIRSHRKRWLLAGVAALVACVAAVAVVALTDESNRRVEVGPTSLAVIDPKSNTVVDAIDLGFKSNLIAAGEGYVWVLDPDGSTLRRVDPHSHEVKNIGIAVGAGVIPFGVAAGYGAVWVALLRGTEEVVLELGPDVGELRRTIPYGAHDSKPILFFTQPFAVGAGAVWAIDPAGGAVWRIPPHGGGARKLAGGLNPRSLAAGDGTVWVADPLGVTKLDATTGIKLGSGSAGLPAYGESASVALDRNALWYAASSRPSIARIDLQSIAPTDTFPVGRGPSGVAVGEGAVWVANSRDGTVSRIDPQGGRARAISLGQVPGGVVAAYGAVWTSPGEQRS
jgi:class 3 adenylate cyclase/streptogramin lyase